MCYAVNMMASFNRCRRFFSFQTLLVLVLVTASQNGVFCLKLTDFVVPNYAGVGSTVTLTCEFDVESATLNSVKWYKDEHEFFRYVPNNANTHTQSFALDGISLDETSSDQNHVTLNNLSFRSSGVYRCEVSTDLPDFKIAYESKNLTVVSYPKWGPRITDIQESYSVGQKIAGNCSVAPSHPKPKITWHINGVPADKRNVDVVEFQGPGTFVSARSTIRFETDIKDFQNENQAIELVCKITLGGLPGTEMEAKSSPTLASRTGTQESALQRLRNSAGFCKGNVLGISTVVILLQRFTNKEYGW